MEKKVEDFQFLPSSNYGLHLINIFSLNWLFFVIMKKKKTAPQYTRFKVFFLLTLVQKKYGFHENWTNIQFCLLFWPVQ